MAKYIANGNIAPSRFVKVDAAEHKVVQADLNSRPCGISGQSLKDARQDVGSTVHAAEGDACEVHDGTGNETDRIQMLELGGTVNRVRGRVRAMKGTFSGGTLASFKATMAAAAKNPELVGVPPSQSQTFAA